MAQKTPEAKKTSDMHAARPAAFDDALTGARGWGLTFADVAFAVATVLVAAAVALWLWFGAGGTTGVASDATDAAAASATQVDGGTALVADGAASALYAVVQNDDGFYQVLPLNEDARVTVTGDLGTNVIEVADGRVRCVESDCANQVCTDTGWVSSPGQMIVCLPHRLVVEVVADPADATPLT